MDKQARKERIENMIAMAEAFHTFEELPLPERFRKLAEWVETHLSAADQAWIYQQWQHVLERSIEEPPDESVLLVERGQPHTRRTP
jgi:predicted ABC-type ATPase